MFQGSITALITPFKEGEVDWRALDNLIEWQIEQGSHGLVVCGTTGESPTLTQDEHKRIVERTVAAVKGRIPVIAGTGSNNTAKAVDMTRHARVSGADAALIVTPYYNNPTQQGLFAHYYRIAGSVNIPILIYNIPSRCVVDMAVETMARLAKLPNIIGVKDATGDLSRPAKTAKMIGADFCQLSGNDDTAAHFLEKGGHGCISVTANVAPAACAALQEAWQKQDIKTFKALQKKLEPLHKALFYESSPAPVKYAVARLGFCTDETRLPIVPAGEPCRKIVDNAMERAKTISFDRETPFQATG